MSTQNVDNMLSVVSRNPLAHDITASLVDRQARGYSPRTYQFYRDELRHLRVYLEEQGHIFRTINKGDALVGAITWTAQAVRDAVVGYTEALGLDDIAPPRPTPNFRQAGPQGRLATGPDTVKPGAQQHPDHRALSGRRARLNRRSV